MIIFDKKDRSQNDEFWQWLRKNPGGFFVNDKGSEGIMIYWPGCSTIEYDEPKPSLTNHPKICSMNREELEDDAKKRNPLELKVCNRCKNALSRDK